MSLDEIHADGHKYWKFKIKSMHQGKDTIWVVGTWFYSPSNLLEELACSNWYVTHSSMMYILNG